MSRISNPGTPGRPDAQVTVRKAIWPAECGQCHRELPRQAGPNDPELKRFQVVEAPPLAATVTEY